MMSSTEYVESKIEKALERIDDDTAAHHLRQALQAVQAERYLCQRRRRRWAWVRRVLGVGR
jgi:hypothetical protein